ncbi:hypothetical protein QQ045_019805 [Rhodiola kirilowii]
MVHADESDRIDWNSEDDREIEVACLASSSRPRTRECEACGGFETHASGSSAFIYKSQFIKMGFPEEAVLKAIKANYEGGNAEEILETLLKYMAIENINEHRSSAPLVHPEDNSPIYISDDGENPEIEDKQEQDEIVAVLVEMGYSEREILIALKRCGANTPIDVLADFIGAAQMAQEVEAISAVHDFSLEENDLTIYSHLHKRYIHKDKKRKLQVPKNEKRKEDLDAVTLPNPMIGFGVPGHSYAYGYRKLPEAATGAPYFYYENVAVAPKGVWAKISSLLYEVQPEFVDSAYFCAANRKRGYIHNLPIMNRFPLMPSPPSTIHEALPSTKEWWPTWDKRTKFNSLHTWISGAKLPEMIRKELEKCDMEPPLDVQNYVLRQCRRWNLVWVGKNKVAPLEPHEIEYLLGFPRDHTRGVSQANRYKSLGNTFPVDTVAYHLSVLKDMYPDGMNVLSIFSGIGGAEVALHKLGIRLKNVVSVEISDINRQILRSWWEQTDQKGTLIEKEDVTNVTNDNLHSWSSTFGGFDLVIGGSWSWSSSLYTEYYRILDHVRSTAGLYTRQNTSHS